MRSDAQGFRDAANGIEIVVEFLDRRLASVKLSEPNLPDDLRAVTDHRVRADCGRAAVQGMSHPIRRIDVLLGHRFPEQPETARRIADEDRDHVCHQPWSGAGLEPAHVFDHLGARCIGVARRLG